MPHHIPLSAMSLDPADDPAPQPDRLVRCCRAHGFAAESIVEMATTGLANRVYALDEAYVLRVARPSAMAESDARTESVAVPAAVHAGIRTPRLLVFDDSGEHLDTPVTIYDRVRGEPLGTAHLSGESRRAAWCAVGMEMARVHTLVKTVDDPHGRLDTPEGSQARPLLDNALTAEAISADDAHWADTLLHVLTPALHDDDTTDRCFVHDDLLPMNIMVRDGEFAALIDWGDAGWGEPGLDWWGVPPEMVEPVFDGYTRAAPLSARTVARALSEQLARALRHLVEPERRDVGFALLTALRAYTHSDAGRTRLERLAG